MCSGIEAASVAWEPLGFHPAWFSEIAPFPSALLAHHYPSVPNVGDMTSIAQRILSGDVEAPDVLIGGTPCQAFSFAGKRASLDDARGNLTLEYVRILDAIDERRKRDGRTPALAVWENVPGVLSTKDNAFGCFLGLLAGAGCALQPAGRRWANAGCVYGPTRAVAWRILDAQYFGVAQRRRRVFVVASAGGRDPAEILFESKELCGATEPSASQRQDIAGTLAAHSLVGGCSSRPAEAVGGLIIGQTDEHWIIRGNAIDRSPKNGGCGHDWVAGVVPTMTTTDRHAVAYSGGGCS